MPVIPPPRAGRHGAGLSGRVAISILAALVAGGASLTGCSPAHHHRGAAATTTSFPPSTTTTEPPPQYAPSPYSWDRAASPALQIGGGPSATLSAVLAPQLTGPWQVFGSRLGASGAPTATVWSSADALTWTAGTLDPSGGPSQALAASRYRNTTVVVGSTGEAAGQQASAWVSTGPGTSFLPETVPASNGPSVMKLVASGPLGMFASGTVDGRFAMWSSTNGRQWSELPGAEKVIGSSVGARVDALLVNGANVYAAGSIQPGPAQQAAVWSSSDGLNWHQVSAATSFSGPGGMAIYALAPFGAGMVAVGAMDPSGTWVPASWISPDGQSWSLPSADFPSVPRATVPAASFGPAGGTAARSVAAIPTVGGVNDVVASGGGPYGQAAWASADGLHWTSLSMPAGPTAAASWRAELIGANIDRAVVIDAEPGQPYLLTDQAGLLSGLSPSSRAPASIAGVWSQPSADGRVFGPVRPQAVPVSLLRQSSGRLQLTVDLVRRPQSVGPEQVTTVVLTSADGSTWTAAPAGTTPAGTPPTDPVPGGLTARLPTGWTAVSPGPAEAVSTWVSATGGTWTPAGPITLAGEPSAAGSTASRPPGPAGGPIALNGICTMRLPSSVTSGAQNSSVPTSTVAPGGSPAAPQARYLVEAVGAVTSVTPGPPDTSGPAGAPTVTRSGAAWYSTTGLSWRDAAVNAAPAPGGAASMSGCEQVASALVAFGSATASSGVPQPALWRSNDGTSWTRSAVSAFASGPPSPLVSLATDGGYWLATANPDPTADPFRAGSAGTRGPAAGAGTDAGVGPAPSLEDGRQAVWLSVNGGAAWQLEDTAAAPWLGSQRSSVDLVGFLPPPGSGPTSPTPTPSPTAPSTTAPSTTAPSTTIPSTTTPNVPIPVIVGVDDGQLVVWIGTAAPQASSGA